MKHFTIVFKQQSGYGTQTFLARNLFEAMFCLGDSVRVEDISSVSSREATPEEIGQFEKAQ